MAGGGDAGAGGSVYSDGLFRGKRLEKQGVRNDTDIGAKADEKKMIAVLYCFRQGGRAEGALFNDDRASGVRGESRAYLPALLRLNAVGNGELLSFGRRKIIGRVRVLCKDEAGSWIDRC